MVDETEVNAGLAEIRRLLNADGGDMELVAVDRDQGVVHTRLVLDGIRCRECVLPRTMLERVGLDILHKLTPGVTELRIDDPREA